MNNIKITNSKGQYFELTADKIGTLEGWEWPETIYVSQNIAGKRPPVFISSKQGRRRFSIFGLDRDCLRSDMITALSVDGGLKLIEFTTLDNVSLQTYAEVLSLKYPYAKQAKPFLIEFESADPKFYSQALYSVETGITDLGGGAGIPTAIPMSFDAVGISRPVIVNLGNVETKPEFVIHGPGTDFSVQNITTGELFNLDITLAEGEIVTVDAINLTVIKGTNTNVFGLFSGEFFSLVVGNNEIHFDVVSGSSSNTKLVVNYRYAYGGI
jgi:hypothetical protein